MADLAKNFGARIRMLRTDCGLTQVELADRVALSEEWIRRIERGEGAPSFQSLEAFSRALGVGVAGLFAEPTDDVARLAAAVEGLSEEALRWLIAGARLLKG